MSMSGRERFWFVLSILLLCTLLIGGQSLTPVSAREDSKDGLYKELKLFTDVLSIVQKDYVREVGDKELIEGAVKGMLSTLDPHSGYLDPSFYQDLQVETKGEFGGLGIEITIKDGLLVVVAPMEDSPAEKAGIRAGDAIVKIEGKFTKEFTLVDAVKRLRGPKGEPIHISILREGSPDLIGVTIIRDKIKVKSVRSRYLGDGFGYVRINQFMEQTSEDLKKALRNLTTESKLPSLRGLILDMRNNPGGLLTQAINVSDMFLKEGIIVYTDGRVENQKQKFFAHTRSTEPDYPIVVLVNGGSASAAEIVAGAFQDHGRALILGERTFGKGSVQTITPLENGGALTLTTALYYTKSGKSIQVTGVTPDIELEQNPQRSIEPEQTEQEREELKIREGDLPGAINNPTGEKGAGGSLRRINKTPVVDKDISRLRLEDMDLNELLAQDAQLSRAFDLLKTFNIFEGRKPSLQELARAESK